MAIRLFLTLLLITSFALSGYGQRLQQRFDGSDTISERSLIIKKDPSSFWQIGPPQKAIFNSPSTPPNVLITDTAQPYPGNDTGKFIFGINLKPFHINREVPYKLQWMQKLDIGKGMDLGIIEFSLDTGKTWTNAFQSDTIENFFGFESKNVDTLSDGSIGFKHVDSNWQDIWLCFSGIIINRNDSLMLRFSLYADSNEMEREGWMIDDMTFTRTPTHVIESEKHKELVHVYPSPTHGDLNIQIKHSEKETKVHKIEIISNQGKVVRTIPEVSSNLSINLNGQKAGIYYIKVYRTDQSRTIPVLLE